MDSIKGKVGESLREHIDSVKLAREITEMVRDLHLVEDLEDLRPKHIEASEVLDIFEELQFGTNLRSRTFRILGVEFEDTTIVPITREEHERGKFGQWVKKHTGGTSRALAVDIDGERLTVLDGDHVGVEMDLAT